MHAFKFLRAGGIGPFSGFSWPLPSDGAPGSWVEPGPAAPLPFRDAVHACTESQLTYWVNDDLWVIELERDKTPSERYVAAARGRLLRRVEAWTDDVAAEFIAACLARAREHAAESGSARVVAYARSAEKLSVKGPAMTGFAAAHAAGVRAVEADGSGYENGRAAERHWQSRWLATRLGIA